MLSYALYTANGSQRQFNVPFAFVSRDHVKVRRNRVIVPTPAYTWSNNSTIEFNEAPLANDAIEIYRETPIGTRLVDFQPGALLLEEDLDLSSTQLLYLIQELKDRYDSKLDGEIIRIGTGNGIEIVDPQEMLSAIISEMLASELLADLQSRITAIDAQSVLNNTAITNLQQAITQITGLEGSNEIEDLQTFITDETSALRAANEALVRTVSLIGAHNGNNSAFVLNLDTVRVDSTTSLATRLSGIDVAVGNVNAAVVAEQQARASADQALASQIGAVQASSEANAAAITAETQARVAAIEAEATARQALAASIGVGNKTYRQDDPPTSGMIPGDLWFDSNDNNRTYRYDGSAWVLTENTSITGVSAAIVAEQQARVEADNALASNIQTLTTTVSDHTTSIQTAAQSISGIEAKYTIKIDNNGYVSGYGLISTANNGAVTSQFTVLADRFAIALPGVAPRVPFVAGTVNGVATVGITGQLIVDGSITANKLTANSITAGQIAANSITADRLVAGTITAESGILANAVIGTAQIQDLTVTTLKVAQFAITGLATATLAAPLPLVQGDNQLLSLTVTTSGGPVALWMHSTLAGSGFNHATPMEIRRNGFALFSSNDAANPTNGRLKYSVCVLDTPPPGTWTYTVNANQGTGWQPTAQCIHATLIALETKR